LVSCFQQYCRSFFHCSVRHVSTSLRSLRSRPVTALHRSYGRSDSCLPGSSAPRSVNTVSCGGQVSLIHVSNLPIPPSPTTGHALMPLVLATLQLIKFPALAGLGFTIGSQARRIIQPNQVRYPTDGSFAFSCSSPRLLATQLLSATGQIASFLMRAFISPARLAFRRTTPAFAGVTGSANNSMQYVYSHIPASLWPGS